MKERKFHMPTAYTILFLLLILVAAATWIIPAGSYDYVDGVPVVGLPGCVMYSKRTVFDLIVPRLLTGEKLSKRDFVLLAHGGQCQNCPVCTYPDCGFGQ